MVDTSFLQSLTNRGLTTRELAHSLLFGTKDFGGDQLQIIGSALPARQRKPSFKLGCLENLRYDTHATSIQFVGIDGLCISNINSQ